MIAMEDFEYTKTIRENNKTILAPLPSILRDQFYWKKGDKLAIKVNPKTGEVTSIKKV